ncbi:MAG: hypothetical protein WAW85_16955 [Gordonia sp. (in: high G+C Gram-positive bacteria)]|uniref:hypothetical protein n=1 Tax=Gordonia sp. (in: high G+C Gram-positive bacteria) TaxID=84139 RepID=UPI003BB4B0B5
MSVAKHAVVVDIANVMGSVPDGWWRDRAGGAARILTQLSKLAEAGISGQLFGRPDDRLFPRWIAVIEGQAKAAKDVPGIDVVRARGEGDDTIVDEAQRLVGEGFGVSVVTRDRGLIQRVESVGADARPVRWLRDMFIS